MAEPAPSRQRESEMTIDAMIGHAGWVLFVWVFANQGGVPVPVVPSLVAAGALAGSGATSLAFPLLAAVAASVCADFVWYGVGRWRGATALRTLSMVSHHPNGCRGRAETMFRAHEVSFQFAARFVPELNPIAAGLAGATGVALGRYVIVSSASAAAWASAWTAAGYLLPSVFGGAPIHLGVTIAVSAALGIVAVMAVPRLRRRRTPA